MSRRYDAGKKVKGRKRRLAVDTIGLVLGCEVHSASIQDRDGAKDVLLKTSHKYPTILKYFADGGYAGTLQNWCFLTLGALLAIARKIVDQVGFKVIPKRWIKDFRLVE